MMFNSILMYGVTITLNEKFFKTVLLFTYFPCLDFSRFLRKYLYMYKLHINRKINSVTIFEGQNIG